MKWSPSVLLSSICFLAGLSDAWRTGTGSQLKSGFTFKLNPYNKPAENIRKYELNITNNAVSPDCGPTVPALLVNGRFNGPTLEANVGEIIEVTVHNKLFSEGTSIHWHGLHLRDAPYYDGAGKITQDLIPPGKSFTYRIPTGEQSGTYFYHAHHALQSQQIHGALIIRDPKTDSQLPHYDEERILEFSDHWHKDSTTQLVGLVANPTFTWIGDAQSLLINGKGPFNGTCATGNSQNWTTIEVEQGKTYRLRLIGSSTLGYFNFEIPNHNLTIVEADGIPVKPYTVSRLEINSGQRYSVLLKADQPPSVYWASLRILWRPAGPTGFALLKYKNAPNDVVTSAQPSFVSPPSKPAESIEWILPKLEPLKGHGKTVPKKADREIVLESTQFTNYTYEGSDTRYVRWIVNNVSFTFPPRPTYFHALEGSLDKLPVTSKPYHIKHNEVVDFIFQAVTSAGGVCEAHPWHIHGNYFYEIESGPGKYDPKLTTPASNATHFENPLPRDSITVFPYQYPSIGKQTSPYGTPCGWKRVRYVADNPGVWFLHCHVTSHIVTGMAVTLVVGEQKDIPKLPDDFGYWSTSDTDFKVFRN